MTAVSFEFPYASGCTESPASCPASATLERTGLEVLVGQQITLNLEMSPSSVAETVTVTGEAPLVNVATSQLGGNIDSRQMRSCR